MVFTEKKLVELLSVTQPALSKALKSCEFTLQEVQGSTKKVKHYKLQDLPQRYIDKLKEQGIEFQLEEPTNISKANNKNFTNVYLLASPEKQKIATLKCKLIEFYMKKDSSLNSKKWLEQTLRNSLEFDALGSVSLKQLYDWYKKYREAKAKGINLVEAFIDTRGAKKGVKALSDEQKTVAERYFVKTSRPMMSQIYENMCHTFGDTMPSYDALNNYYKEWKAKNPALYAMSRSPDGAKNNLLSAFGSESEKAKYRNHYWELDSTPADVMCADGKRYTVLCAIDVYSRRAIYHVAESSSAYSISQLLRKAIIKLGIPENVIIDNGKDYLSAHFEGVCLNLGIDRLVVPPFSGESKPHVERMFGTQTRELFEQIPGYIGHNVEQRSELQARMSFAGRIASIKKWHQEQKLKSPEEKKSYRDAWKIKKENIGLKLTILFTPDELQDTVDKWTERIYEQRKHRGLKNISPIQKWNENKTPVESVPDVRMLDLLLGESFERTVGKKGISFDGCTYIHEELVEYIGSLVKVMAPDDMGKILVYSIEMKLICIAEDVEHTGESRYIAKKSRKRSQAWLRTLNKIIKEAESTDDVTILDRIDDACDIVESKTTVVVRRTDSIDMLIEGSKTLEAQDVKALKCSIHRDFTKKDKDGLPPKVLANGRPRFKGFKERFVWVLEHPEEENETDRQLMQENYEIYRIAHDEFLRRQAS